MTGCLYLLPVSLGMADWSAYLPPTVRDKALLIDYFVVENAKSARAELRRLGYAKPLRECRIEALPNQPSPTDLNRLLHPILSGQDGGLMSEAGCPAVADPGAILIREAHRTGIRVVPLVGPSALLLALMGSGLNGQSFAFHGYLPIDETARDHAVRDLESESGQLGRTQIFIETPYRNLRMFATILRVCQSSTSLCLATEVTTNTESIATRTIAEWRNNPQPLIDKRPTVFLLLAGRSAKTHA